MLSLSEQYALETKKIDSDIFERLKDAFDRAYKEQNSEEILNGDATKPLREKIENRKNEILSLFIGNFDENKDKVMKMNQDRMTSKKHMVDGITELANGMIKKIVSTILDSMIDVENSGAIETGLVMDRKNSIEEILERNFEINLNQEKYEELEEPEER